MYPQRKKMQPKRAIAAIDTQYGCALYNDVANFTSSNSAADTSYENSVSNKFFYWLSAALKCKYFRNPKYFTTFVAAERFDGEVKAG